MAASEPRPPPDNVKEPWVIIDQWTAHTATEHSGELDLLAGHTHVR
ncbi:MAG TPA: hypothetical protein PKY77_13045 [Phycisphaerae bacterium]|nr:hypothetical protein [Phycisphaerae bacterium]HRY68278.1 hypothetical protein [Phycisphaerae bacterium]HSA26839.1 hypothetical protein [Phycisphaerae bacterium]